MPNEDSDIKVTFYQELFDVFTWDQGTRVTGQIDQDGIKRTRITFPRPLASLARVTALEAAGTELDFVTEDHVSFLSIGPILVLNNIIFEPSVILDVIRSDYDPNLDGYEIVMDETDE